MEYDTWVVRTEYHTQGDEKRTRIFKADFCGMRQDKMLSKSDRPLSFFYSIEAARQSVKVILYTPLYIVFRNRIFQRT